MRYLKSYKLFESSKDNIEDISYECIDIMRELEDSGFRIETQVIPINSTNKLRLTCHISRKTAFGWGRYKVVDIYDRLSSYLNSVGFVEISRSLGDVSKFPIIDGMYQASIVFDKI